MTDLRFALPIHADRADDTHDDQSDCAHDPHVIDASVHDADSVVLQQVVERVTEPYGVHTGGYCVGEREDYADGSAELRAQRARDDIVDSTCKLGVALVGVGILVGMSN